MLFKAKQLLIFQVKFSHQKQYKLNYHINGDLKIRCQTIYLGLPTQNKGVAVKQRWRRAVFNFKRGDQTGQGLHQVEVQPKQVSGQYC